MDRYEHHNNLETNRLCPFKLGKIKGTPEEIYNWHKNIEIILVTGGEGKIRHGTDEMSLVKGDVAIISSNVMHRLYSIGGFEFYYFIFGDSFCLENGINVKEYVLEPKVRDETLNMLYLAVVDRIKAKEREGGVMSVLALRTAVQSLLCYVFTNYSHTVAIRETSMASEEYVKRAVTYISDHYTEDILLDSLATHCGISKYHLAREFKKHTGQTVVSYLNILRCNRASVLLAEGKTVTEAASACGYESISYFSKVFTRHMGVPPSAFKEG